MMKLDMSESREDRTYFFILRAVELLCIFCATMFVQILHPYFKGLAALVSHVTHILIYIFNFT